MPIDLIATPLTPQAFAPYGQVLQAPQGSGRWINGGNAERFDLVADLQLHGAGGRAMLAVFRAKARHFPHAVDAMERHALGSQLFLPAFAPDGAPRRFVVVVAPAGGPPLPDALAAFATDGSQGIVLAPGTWHHALLAVDGGDYLVIERAGEGVDCDVVTMPAARSVRLAEDIGSGAGVGRSSA
jgi:ureidoglycolate lyase